MTARFYLCVSVFMAVFMSQSSSHCEDSADAKVQIAMMFERYQSLTWENKIKHLTPRAKYGLIGDVVFSHRARFRVLRGKYGIEDVDVPPPTANYRSLPKEPAIIEAHKVRKQFVMVLSRRLGIRLGEFIDELTEDDPESPVFELDDILVNGDDASAEMLLSNSEVTVPVQFKKSQGKWYFDGKDGVLFFDRQRYRAR